MVCSFLMLCPILLSMTAARFQVIVFGLWGLCPVLAMAQTAAPAKLERRGMGTGREAGPAAAQRAAGPPAPLQAVRRRAGRRAGVPV